MSHSPMPRRPLPNRSLAERGQRRALAFAPLPPAESLPPEAPRLNMRRAKALALALPAPSRWLADAVIIGLAYALIRLI